MKGKKDFWNAFLKADSEILKVLSEIGLCKYLSENQLLTLEKFICRVYSSSCIETVSALRWNLFRTKQSESEKLPPTREALNNALHRSHFQSIVWCSCDIPNT